MTGREKIEAAFSQGGAAELPVVICYESVFIRDHWPQLTSCPWWYLQSPDAERQERWSREVAARVGQDWVHLFPFCSTDERADQPIEERADGVYRLDPSSGSEQELTPPQVSGWNVEKTVESVRVERLPETFDEIDHLLRQQFGGNLLGGASHELASRMVECLGRERFPYRHVSGPFWSTYGLWGFEGMMTLAGTRPDLVKHACDRILIRTLAEIHEYARQGMAGIWIEDCLMDMLSPAAFANLDVPFIRRIVDEIRGCGMKSIYYYTGNPAGKLELILSIGADALSFEESKKDFRVDIEELAGRLAGQCVLLGNLDAVGVLQTGDESQLREELCRQIRAGRKNRSRFIMSLGSPVTPDTPVERVRLYCDLARELGKS